MILALTPTREQGQEWARSELAKREYQEADLSLLERVGRAISSFFNRIFSDAVMAENPWALIVVLLAVAALVAFIVWRVRTLGGGRLVLPPRPEPMFDTRPDPAALRKHAREAAAAAQWTPAVQYLLRAIMAQLAHSGYITIQPAATAHELAAAAGSVVPAHSVQLRSAADLFDRITFGTDTAEANDYHTLVALDEAVLTLPTHTSNEPQGEDSALVSSASAADAGGDQR